MREYSNKTKLDKHIEETPGYIKMVKSVMFKMFDLNTDELDVKKIYIDVNSCISIVFRTPDINDPQLIQEVKKILEEFINREVSKGVKLIFLFTLDPSKLHTDIYPDWCKERYERVSILKNTFIRNFLIALREYEKNNSSIKIINTKQYHPALVVYQNEFNTRRNFLVLSKDLVFQSLNLIHGCIYNGVHFSMFGDPMRDLPDLVELNDADTMIPYYLSLAGSSREEFKGVKGYGPAKASKYCNTFRIQIKMGDEHEFKEHMDKYSVLFDIRKLMDRITENDEIPVV